jgi:hypothetical protein
MAQLRAARKFKLRRSASVKPFGHKSHAYVEYSISVLAFTVDFLAFVESDNRRESRARSSALRN